MENSLDQDNRQIVVSFLNSIASGYADSVSPGSAVIYRKAADSLASRNDRTLALKLLREKETYLAKRVESLTNRLAEVRTHRLLLENL